MIKVLTGKITRDANKDSNMVSISYPSGFTKDNTYVISLNFKNIDGADYGWSSPVYYDKMTSQDKLRGAVPGYVYLSDKIIITVGSPYTESWKSSAGGNYNYRLVLLKI